MPFNPYLAIARPDHWLKNVFALPGVVLAAMLTDAPLGPLWWKMPLGMAALCLAASANYVINEWLDADFDRLHPEKKQRAAAMGLVRPGGVYLEYALLIAASVAMGLFLGRLFTACVAALLIQGVFYNVPPLRTKDLPYLDVLSESVNNPIRLCLGWFLLTQEVLPPSSLLGGYWAAGGFLMAVKRYAEFRAIGDSKLAGKYRASFKHYSEQSLLINSFFYATLSAFFLGVFVIKHRVELLLAGPFLAVMFAWYLKLGMQENSAAQHPELLHKEKGFMAFSLAVGLFVMLLCIVDVPPLHWFLQNLYHN